MSDHGALPSFPGQGDDRVGSGAGSEYASWGVRVGAYLLDAIVLGVVSIGVAAIFGVHGIFTLGHYHTVNGKRLFAVHDAAFLRWLLIIQVLQLAYAIALLASKWSATVGMRLLSIHLEMEDGSRPSFGRILGRVGILFAVSLVGSGIPLLGLLAIIVDFLWPLWDARNQTVHDKLVHTVVVQGKTR